jgi:hypothetical protein
LGKHLHRYFFNAAKICSLLLAATTVGTVPPKAEEYREEWRDFLKCTSQCTDRKRPSGFPALDRPKDVGRDKEGVVEMIYTVAADGSTKDIRLVTLYGPKSYGDNAMKLMTHAHHEPATENGHPIDFYGFDTINTYQRFPHPNVRVKDYMAAMDLTKAGNQDAALEDFDRIVFSDDADLRTRFMAAYQEASLFRDRNDLDQALYYIRIATHSEGRLLSKNAISTALHIKLLIAAASGQYAEALVTYDILKKYQVASPEDSKLATDLESRVAGAEPIQVRGWVHDNSLGGAWQHQLFRRKFEFYKINGKLDHFELYCDGHELKSAINETSAWIIPSNWSNCNIFVLGDNGTTFQFYEQ